ncbi:hypothetical protein ABID39_001535 [Bartonella japonica]|uniref:Uncharacterized protein n=1 Tax=Bartonella japonica TaxID=357761 RepID=A0ABV2FQH3_9HYPH
MRLNEDNALEACLWLHRLIAVKASNDDIANTFRLFSASGFQMRKDMDSDACVMAYQTELKGVSLFVLKEALKRIVCGKVEGMSKKFMPRASDFSEYCEELEKDLLSRAKTLHEFMTGEFKSDF